MNNCNPVGSPPTVDNPCEMLGALRAAYFQLLSGQAQAEARFGDQFLRWQRGDAKTLEREIRRLEMICDSGINVGRAVQVGRHPHRHPFRFY